MLQRYYTKEKFEWLLQDEGFFLSPLDKQSDKNDGTYDHERGKDLTPENYKKMTGREETQDDIAKAKFLVDECGKNQHDKNRAGNYISCWFCNDDESEKMWKEYGRDNSALLIIVGLDLLKAFLTFCARLGQTKKFNYHLCEYGKDEITSFNPFHKDSKFQDENEYRLLYNDNIHIESEQCKSNVEGPDVEDTIRSMEAPSDDNVEKWIKPKIMNGKLEGFILKLDLNHIIKEVRVHKDACEEYKKEIKQILRNNGFDQIPVNDSSLK